MTTNPQKVFLVYSIRHMDPLDGAYASLEDAMTILKSHNELPQDAEWRKEDRDWWECGQWKAEGHIVQRATPPAPDMCYILSDEEGCATLGTFRTLEGAMQHLVSFEGVEEGATWQADEEREPGAWTYEGYRVVSIEMGA